MTVSVLIPPELDDSVVAQIVVPAPIRSKGVLMKAVIGSGDQTITPEPIGGNDN